MFNPKFSTTPSGGTSNVASILNVVVLLAPFGPMSPKTSPFSTLKLMFLMTFLFPKYSTRLIP